MAKRLKVFDQSGGIVGDWVGAPPTDNDTLVGIASTQTLTNKTLTSPTINTPTITVLDNALTIQDNGDTTKQAAFQCSGITAGQTRTLTIPDASTTIVGHDTTQTLTNKTLTAPTISGGTATGLTGLAIRDTSAAFDVTIAAVSSSALTAGRTLTLDMINAARSIKLAGNIDIAGNLITSGANALTLTTTGATNVTLPTTGTLATLAGVEAFTNKTITTPTETITVQAVAAAGTVQGDAGAVTAVAPALIHGTGADGTKGIVLPAAAAGKVYWVKNADAANNILKVYPASGDAINAIAADGAISMAAKTAAAFVALDATTWFTFSLLPS